MQENRLLYHSQADVVAVGLTMAANLVHDSGWLDQGAKRFEERLREQTEKVMAHKPAPLPAEILQELDRMAQHW